MRLISKLFVIILSILTATALAQTPIGTAITYQGLLTQSDTPATGQFCFNFRLYDAPTAGNQVGPELTPCDVHVTDGQFSVDLDFGPDAFNGEARWLQIQVITNGGQVTTTLLPRQRIAPAPEAIFAQNAATAQVAVQAQHALNSIPTGAAILTSSSIPPDNFSATGETLITTPTPGQWELNADFPTPHTSAFVGEINGNLYLVNFQGVFRYDKEEDTWTFRTGVPNQRHDFAATVHAGEIYITGGRVGPVISNLTQSYDPATNTWATHANAPKVLHFHSCVSLGDALFVFGGNDGNTDNTQMFRFRPNTNSWSQLGSSPVFIKAKPAVVDNRIFVFEATNSSGSNTDVHEYNPSIERWAIAQSVPGLPMKGRATAVINNKIHVIGGSINDLNQLYNLHLIFDPATYTWSTNAADLPVKRSHGNAVATGSTLYYIAGYNEIGVNTNTVFQLEAGQSTKWHLHTKD